MRRSFDALALVVQEKLALDPQSGALFVFASKRGNRLKVLWFDRNGYCILYKRLHAARFELPDASRSDRPVAMMDLLEHLARARRGSLPTGHRRLIDVTRPCLL